MQIVYSYKDVPTIREFSEDKSFIRGLMGPFGSGKSSGCVMEIIRKGQQQRPNPRDGIRRTRWAVIRNSYPQLKDTTIKTFMDWFPEKYFGQYKISDHDYYITKIPGVYIEVLFRALDRPEHVSNLLSMELTGAWLNEAREIPFAIYEAIQGRVKRYPSRMDGGRTWSGIIFDTNPPDTRSWIYNTFEKGECPSNARLFKQPSGLSPEAENMNNLDPDYYTNLAIGKDPGYVTVYIHGQYGSVRDGKPCYPNYRDDIHCAKEELKPYPGLPIIVGVDFGLTPAAAICQVSPTGKFRVLDEVISQDMGIRRFARTLLKPLLNTKYRNFSIIGMGDPAGNTRVQTNEVTCYQELKAAGIPMLPAPTNTLAARMGAVDHFLTTMVEGHPAFELSPTCDVLRKGFISDYKFKKIQGSSERYTEAPEKNEYSHPHDGLQYAAMAADGGIITLRRRSIFDGPGRSVRRVPKEAWT